MKGKKLDAARAVGWEKIRENKKSKYRIVEDGMAKYKRGDKGEYVILLDLLARANNAVEGSSISDAGERERLISAHNLANKFIGHALTILYISHGTVIQDLPSFPKYKFVDSASIDVLTRAAMEAFLVFHYVFCAPKTKDEKEFRYWLYWVAGLAEKQNFPEATYEHTQVKEKEKKQLDELRSKLDSNLIFQKLRDKQKQRIFEGKGNWKWKSNGEGTVSWRDIAIAAGFSDMLASHIYKHLSGSAHSGSLSVLQTAQALVNKETEKLTDASIDTMKVLLANMIQEYCGLFIEAQDVLNQSGASQFVGTWVKVGCRLDEGLKIGGKND